MSDKIFVHRIAVFAYHGLHVEESRLGQRFYISLVAGLDTRAAGRSNDLGQTVDYGRMTDITVAIATQNRYPLIEALAETVAARLLAEFPLIDEITVRVDKPSAPIAHVIDGASVEITRSRADG